MVRYRLFLLGFVLLLCLGLQAAEVFAQNQHTGFVGTQACANCHEKEAELWRGSDHAHAMLEATDQSVLAPFAGETFEKDGVTTKFFRRDGKFFVNTDGPDGKQADFEVSYTFGISPLQQYLIEMPGGRYQAFGIAWDSRPAEQGGQRWFHLYPDQKLTAGDPIHWTGIDQNWNYQCAWCHSTDLKKNYDPAKDSFSTVWAEINVGCEACHGPGAAHVAWANTPETERSAVEEGAGLAINFNERKGISWSPDPRGTAVRSQPRKTSTEINECAGCHARRGQFSDDAHSVLGLFDAFRPSLLAPGLYFPDGQQLGEVYKYGSFLQSKMHAAGVTCSDCHDPHSGKLVLEGNSVCGQCHEPAVFDTPKHHHHEMQTAGAECASCHMPTTNYMVIDARHDHSLRIPRPDLTISAGIPNACNRCHQDKDASWSMGNLREWYGEPIKGAQDFAELFVAADHGAPGSREALIAYVRQDGHAPIATASALQRLSGNADTNAMLAAVGKLSSPEPLVRSAAIQIVGQAPSQNRLKLLAPLLEDDMRLVRMDAARALAGEPEAQMDDATRSKFEKALAEYVDSELFNAERPESNSNLANLELERGNAAQARHYYETALARDPSFEPAIVGLSEVLRRTVDEASAEKLLREKATAYSDSPGIAHALGLSFARKGDMAQALEWLQKAARLGPDDPRYAYVYAIALHDTGKPGLAITALKTSLLRHPYDMATLNALVSYQVEAGDLQSALENAGTLAALAPGNAAMRNLIQTLQQRLGK